MHLVYFTAWVDDDGKLRTFGDIYGHEKRITLALDGNWDQIDIGRNHLAPVEATDPSNFTPAPMARSNAARSSRDDRRHGGQRAGRRVLIGRPRHELWSLTTGPDALIRRLFEQTVTFWCCSVPSSFLRPAPSIGPGPGYC